MQRSSVVVTPALLLAILAVTVLAAFTLVPGARREAALSLGRQPARYLEVYLPASAQPPRCRSGRPTFDVPFVMVSHLARPTRVSYAVVVSAGHGRLRTARGQALLSPGHPVQVVQTMRRPRGSEFGVAVRLPGRAEGLRLRCLGPASAARGRS
jgi:hypothetical protein